MDKDYRLELGDCTHVLQELLNEGVQVDSVVTDPPYLLNFMNKEWDSGDITNDASMWSLVKDVMKPGAHLLAFGATRTHHRMMCAIEDAGFEIRDCLMWVYGSGFPRSTDIGKQFIKRGLEGPGEKWSGWGATLKPAYEPIILARKPLGEKSLLNNLMMHEVGALNINDCLVGEEAGRYPTNFIHDGSEEVVREFPFSKGQQGDVKGTEPSTPTNHVYGDYNERLEFKKRNDEGSAARFFYCAKASKEDRGEYNTHATVKPENLMRYLCRMVTPKDGLILDPFMGSGSTGKAALKEGNKFIGIEIEKENFDIAERRLEELEEKNSKK